MPRIPASTTTVRRTWRRRHSGRPQHAELADPLEDVHRERVDDAERGDDDGDDRQGVEQAEDPAEGDVDGARDAARAASARGPTPWRARRPSAGRRPRGRARSGPRARRRRRRRATPSRPSSRRGSSRRRSPAASARRCRRPAAAGPGRRRSRGRAPTRRSRSSRVGEAPAGRSTKPPSSRALSAVGPVAGDEPQPAVGEEVRAHDRRRVRPDAAHRDVERGDRADPGDAVDRGDARPTISSSRAIGRIEVRSSSPGITSSSHALAAAREWPATPPIATIIARPAVIAPTVSAVRLRSRASAARASRSSSRNSQRNGQPATRAMPPSRNGESSTTPSSSA